MFDDQDEYDDEDEETRAAASHRDLPSDAEIDRAALLDPKAAAALHVLTATGFRGDPAVWDYVWLARADRDGLLAQIEFRRMWPEEGEFTKGECAMLAAAEALYCRGAGSVRASEFVEVLTPDDLRRVLEAVEIADGRRAWTPLGP